ncbi:MAG: hypothetical protein GYA55_11260, partial [SAR324 cluster bacterium]|nr:hypothetical protein [SAR324 cluster bacterium]
MHYSKERYIQAFDEVQQIAQIIGLKELVDEAHTIQTRVVEGRFYVACLGQFKRGKSTLINALIDEDVLPTGIVPLTSIPTLVRYGEHSARVRKDDNEWVEIALNDLAEYVSEEKNPGNVKRVKAVEVYIPSPILSSGLCFADTPGIGSIFEANSLATWSFVPHVDAALVVIGSDPPITAEELKLIKELAQFIKNFIFVLNKADRLTSEELVQGREFARSVLAEALGHPIEDIYEVSALEQRQNHMGTRDWNKLKETLNGLCTNASDTLVIDMAARALRRLSLLLSSAISEQILALERPIEESEKRLQALELAALNARQSLQDLGPLFEAQLRRISIDFEKRRKLFLNDILPKAVMDLESRAANIQTIFGPAIRAEMMALAQK